MKVLILVLIAIKIISCMNTLCNQPGCPVSNPLHYYCTIKCSFFNNSFKNYLDSAEIKISIKKDLHEKICPKKPFIIATFGEKCNCAEGIHHFEELYGDYLDYYLYQLNRRCDKYVSSSLGGYKIKQV